MLARPLTTIVTAPGVTVGDPYASVEAIPVTAIVTGPTVIAGEP